MSLCFIKQVLSATCGGFTEHHKREHPCEDSGLGCNTDDYPRVCCPLQCQFHCDSTSFCGLARLYLAKTAAGIPSHHSTTYHHLHIFLQSFSRSRFQGIECRLFNWEIQKIPGVCYQASQHCGQPELHLKPQETVKYKPQG